MPSVNDESGLDRTSDAAHSVWNQRYGTRRIKLERHDEEPFKTGRWLGSGGWGSIYQTDVNGVIMALKKMDVADVPREHSLFENELKIMETLSGNRHRHIVELIGSYQKRRERRKVELGLLIWPVAQCDLSNYLDSMDTLLACVKTRQSGGVPHAREDEDGTLEDIAKLVQMPWKSNLDLQSPALHEMTQIYQASVGYLRARIGCLAEAVAYLHNDQQIRHKDLKPAQVLLAPDGLWLTDFGWSLDISELGNSATNNGDSMTPRYHAPERATRGQLFCGRSEDIFALGCIYLEMMYRIRGQSFESNVNKRVKGWSYQANLDQIG